MSVDAETLLARVKALPRYLTVTQQPLGGWYEGIVYPPLEQPEVSEVVKLADVEALLRDL